MPRPLRAAVPAVALLLGSLAAAVGPAEPQTPACAAKLAADCAAAKAQGTPQCVQCVAAHKRDLVAAGCTAIDTMGYCSGPPPPPPPPAPPSPARPIDSPCVTWCQAGCSGVCADAPHITDYLPAIYVSVNTSLHHETAPLG